MSLKERNREWIIKSVEIMLKFEKQWRVYKGNKVDNVIEIIRNSENGFENPQKIMKIIT